MTVRSQFSVWRALRVAWTLTDLGGSDSPSATHVAAALDFGIGVSHERTRRRTTLGLGPSVHRGAGCVAIVVGGPRGRGCA
ncbi:hypothetical protein NWP13_22115 [Rhodococcus pyridinivorans]|nr:hypothetical protein [Rhodococcus pyridinivorans]